MVSKGNLTYLQNARKPPLIEEAFLLLNVCGLNPLKQNIFTKILAVCTLLSLFILDVEIMSELVINWRGMDSMFDVTLFFGFYQIFFKIFSLMVHRGKVIELLCTIENFWQFDAKEVEDIYSTIKKLFKWIIIMVSILVVTFCISPIIFKTLLFNTYHPLDLNSSPDYEIMYFLQCYGTVIGGMGYYGCEAMFIFFIVCITSEFKVIRERIRMLPVKYEKSKDHEELLKELGLIVDQHNLVLRFIGDVNNLYSLIILNHSITSVFSISTPLVTMLVGGFADVLKFIRAFIYGLGFLTLFFLYCFFGEVLTTAGESVADGILESNWPNIKDPKFRKACILITQRSQKEERITAAGMFYLNLTTFTSVINSSISFIALFQAVYKE